MGSTTKASSAARPLVLTAILALTILLGACGSGSSSPSNSVNPSVHITSAPTTTGPAYELTGFVFDNVGITDLVYTVGDGDQESLSHANGSFSSHAQPHTGRQHHHRHGD